MLGKRKQMKGNLDFRPFQQTRGLWWEENAKMLPSGRRFLFSVLLLKLMSVSVCFNIWGWLLGKQKKDMREKRSKQRYDNRKKTLTALIKGQEQQKKENKVKQREDIRNKTNYTRSSQELFTRHTWSAPLLFLTSVLSLSFVLLRFLGTKRHKPS